MASAEEKAAAKAASAEEKAGPEVAYTAADKKIIKKLQGYGVELDGTESSEVLATLLEKAENDEDGEEKPEEVIPGVPNDLTPRHEILLVAGKEVKHPIHFVVAVKGGTALYNEFGRRISHVAATKEEQSALAKAAARNNALRRTNRHPGEMTQ